MCVSMRVYVCIYTCVCVEEVMLFVLDKFMENYFIKVKLNR